MRGVSKDITSVAVILMVVVPIIAHIIQYFQTKIEKRDHFETRLFSDLKYKRPFSMNCRERGSHARGVYSTQGTSRMGTAKAK